ncbi:hypothetical protein QEH34_gp22 [Microbacterium phage Footloose]|uniref:Uncharacterized protein n=1 Tax=Microbacterium phage Footloose TaxID=2836048 RepID=A0A8F3E9F6_9CAUD|nr:hypothetical protein QEH34_gp22 [Microbacterium phage Footloose]QWY84604.1 hypothetical protein SEA_FOOTLOOSE_22 [Microbacterium phage Footloose]
MVADSRDPQTGAYIFQDSGAPDIGVDQTLISEQANDVGTRIIRANLNALIAYPYKRVGLRGYAAETDVEYVYTNAGWKVVYAGWRSWTPTYTAITIGSGAVNAKYQQQGQLVEFIYELDFAPDSGSPGPVIAISLPVPPADPTKLRHIGHGLFHLQGLATYTVEPRLTGSNNFTVNFPTTPTGQLAHQIGVSGTNLSGTYPTGAAWAPGRLYVYGKYEVA